MASNYSLENYKSEQEKLFDQKRDAAKQAAFVNHQKLLKYLPQQTAGQSLGMTETAKIAASNAYQQNVAAADAAFAEGMSELNNYVRTEQERLDDKAKAEQDETFNNVMTTIDSQTWNTTADLENYIKGYEGKVSDTQWQEIQGRLKYYQENPDQQAADNAYNDQKTLAVSAGKTTDVGGYLSNTNAGNNFTIGNYKVELGEAAAEGAVPADKVAKIADKVPFAYNGGIYIKINGTVYAVRGRGGKLDSDGYKDALDYLVNGKKAAATDGSAQTTTSDTAGVSQTTPTSSSTTHWEKYYGNNKKHR